jgi:hypothetical protein
MSPALLDVVVEALQAAGATEEMVAAAVGAYGAWERAPRLRGRPRKHTDDTARKRAWKKRATKPAGCVPGHETGDENTARPR